MLDQIQQLRWSQLESSTWNDFLNTKIPTQNELQVKLCDYIQNLENFKLIVIKSPECLRSDLRKYYILDFFVENKWNDHIRFLKESYQEFYLKWETKRLVGSKTLRTDMTNDLQYKSWDTILKTKYNIITSTSQKIQHVTGKLINSLEDIIFDEMYIKQICLIYPKLLHSVKDKSGKSLLQAIVELAKNNNERSLKIIPVIFENLFKNDITSLYTYITTHDRNIDLYILDLFCTIPDNLNKEDLRKILQELLDKNLFRNCINLLDRYSDILNNKLLRRILDKLFLIDNFETENQNDLKELVPKSLEMSQNLRLFMDYIGILYNNAQQYPSNNNIASFLILYKSILDYIRSNLCKTYDNQLIYRDLIILLTLITNIESSNSPKYDELLTKLLNIQIENGLENFEFAEELSDFESDKLHTILTKTDLSIPNTLGFCIWKAKTEESLFQLRPTMRDKVTNQTSYPELTNTDYWRTKSVTIQHSSPPMSNILAFPNTIKFSPV